MSLTQVKPRSVRLSEKQHELLKALSKVKATSIQQFSYLVGVSRTSLTSILEKGSGSFENITLVTKYLATEEKKILSQALT